MSKPRALLQRAGDPQPVILFRGTREDGDIELIDRGPDRCAMLLGEAATIVGARECVLFISDAATARGLADALTRWADACDKACAE